MTLEQASHIARLEAVRAQAAMIVYRLKAWPEGAYGVRAEAKGFPPEAEQVEKAVPGAVAAAVVRVCEEVSQATFQALTQALQPVHDPQDRVKIPPLRRKRQAPRQPPQGSLFE